MLTPVGRPHRRELALYPGEFCVADQRRLSMFGGKWTPIVLLCDVCLNPFWAGRTTPLRSCCCHGKRMLASRPRQIAWKGFLPIVSGVSLRFSRTESGLLRRRSERSGKSWSSGYNFVLLSAQRAIALRCFWYSYWAAGSDGGGIGIGLAASNKAATSFRRSRI